MMEVVVDLFRVGRRRMENALMATELRAICVAQGRIHDLFEQRKITKLSNLSTKNDLKKDMVHLLQATTMRLYLDRE